MIVAAAVGVALVVSNAILALALWGERRDARRLLERVAAREPGRNAWADGRTLVLPVVRDAWTPGDEPMRPRPRGPWAPTRPPAKPSDMGHRPPPPSPGVGRIGRPS